MESHYVSTPLRRSSGAVWGIDSRASWAIKPTGTCVVFVHGFGGKSTGTWLEFPRFLPMEEACAPIDLVFFGYDGQYDTAARSASRLLEFLRALHTKPTSQVIGPSLPSGAEVRPVDFAYKRVYICAHSLGAVVSRMALIEAARTGKKPRWLSKNRLMFFAPAHKGARIIALASRALTGISVPFAGVAIDGSMVEVLLKARMRVLQDLEINSPVLTDLEAATNKALKNGTASSHLIAHVAHADGDQIVLDTAFALDHETEFISGKGHMSVCKPILGYLKPMELLLDWMKLEP